MIFSTGNEAEGQCPPTYLGQFSVALDATCKKRAQYEDYCIFCH